MDTLKKNKQFVLEYFNAISGVEKTDELIDRFMDDDELKHHIQFCDTIFPNYELLADEMTAEGNRVIVLARVKGKHEGELNGIPPTHKMVDFPFAIGYIIDKGIIVDHWMIADQASLMEQLGVAEQMS
jgi:predicted ester cyclase